MLLTSEFGRAADIPVLKNVDRRIHKDPATGAVHTRFSARVSGADAPAIMVSVAWRGRFKMGGGYPQDPEDGYLKLGDKPANAPVMWANGDSPFRFQRWHSGRSAIGDADDFKAVELVNSTGRE
jgi:hypothetical protein